MARTLERFHSVPHSGQPGQPASLACASLAHAVGWGGTAPECRSTALRRPHFSELKFPRMINLHTTSSIV